MAGSPAKRIARGVSRAVAWASLVALLVGAVAATGREGAALGQAFELRVGESARIESEALEIGFESVLADSRCAKGQVCVWEGDAVVRIWLRVGSEAPVTRELHTAARERGAASHQGYTARLLRLDPPRVVGRVPRPEDYRASFEVAPGSGAPPEMRWAGAEATGGATEARWVRGDRPAPTPDAEAWQR
jgi:hypothetical protein